MVKRKKVSGGNLIDLRKSNKKETIFCNTNETIKPVKSMMGTIIYPKETVIAVKQFEGWQIRRIFAAETIIQIH